LPAASVPDQEPLMIFLDTVAQIEQLYAMDGYADRLHGLDFSRMATC
jgi:hypothetical protein